MPLCNNLMPQEEQLMIKQTNNNNRVKKDKSELSKHKIWQQQTSR
jgi:hypothetical protein